MLALLVLLAFKPRQMAADAHDAHGRSRQMAADAHDAHGPV